MAIYLVGYEYADGKGKGYGYGAQINAESDAEARAIAVRGNPDRVVTSCKPRFSAAELAGPKADWDSQSERQAESCRQMNRDNA